MATNVCNIYDSGQEHDPGEEGVVGRCGPQRKNGANAFGSGQGAPGSVQ